jgi:hypothetical protein
VLTALEKAKLDQEVVGWVERLISRNDKPLAQLIEELIISTGDVGEQLLAAVPDLAGLAVATRTHVSHPGVKGPEVLVQHRLGQVLTWVIRARLLAELGISVSTLAATTTPKPAFQHDVQELAALHGTHFKASRTRRTFATTGLRRRGRLPLGLKRLLRNLLVASDSANPDDALICRIGITCYVPASSDVCR